jgi:hypothetical protein
MVFSRPRKRSRAEPGSDAVDSEFCNKRRLSCCSNFVNSHALTDRYGERFVCIVFWGPLPLPVREEEGLSSCLCC